MAEKRLHELFGYEQQWRVFPIEDHTEDYWMDFSDGQFEGKIAWQRHLSKWVYRTPTHTMALVDTRCDMNVILMVFDNAKECTDAAMKALYKEHWG